MKLKENELIKNELNELIIEKNNFFENLKKSRIFKKQFINKDDLSSKYNLQKFLFYINKFDELKDRYNYNYINKEYDVKTVNKKYIDTYMIQNIYLIIEEKLKLTLKLIEYSIKYEKSNKSKTLLEQFSETENINLFIESNTYLFFIKDSKLKISILQFVKDYLNFSKNKDDNNIYKLKK